MKSLGQIGYEAFAKHCADRHNSRLPTGVMIHGWETWNDLDDLNKEAWEAAGHDIVLRLLGHVNTSPFLDRWQKIK